MPVQFFPPGLFHTPEFTPAVWLNTEQPLWLASLEGQAVLVDFWDYSSPESLLALPYVRQWHERYAHLGLAVIGVHTPQYAFGKERAQVELALEELDIRYPVLMDNDYRVWRAFGHISPSARYLIDAGGCVRAQAEGIGDISRLEQAIQTLLREMDAQVDLPPVLPSPAFQQVPHDPPTPTLRGGLRRGALGNPEGYARAPLIYRLPEQREPGAFYVAGAWGAGDQVLIYHGRTEGVVHVPYQAAGVSAVFTPHVDPVERIIHPQVVAVEIWQDGQPLSDEQRGDDITDDGRILVNRPRVYHLIRNQGVERHELALRVRSQGFGLYRFAFEAR